MARYRKKSVRAKKSNKVKRRYRARRKQVRNRTTVPVGLGFPKKIVMTHKYCETVDITSVLGVMQKYQWRVNGMYDPNTTGTGHQPFYFDQMAAIYNHYTVIGSKIVIEVAPESNTSGGYYAGLYIDDDSNTTNIDSITTLAEQTSGKFITHAPDGDKTHKLVAKWSAKKVFGGSVMANSNLGSSVTTDPIEQQHFTLGIQGFSTSGNTSIKAMVTIHYIAVWDELKQIGPS